MTTKTTTSKLARLKARIQKWEGRIARGDALQQRRKAKLAALKKRLKVMGALIALSLSVQASQPPLSPAEAVRVLQASRSDRHVRDLFVATAPQPPRVVIVTKPAPPPTRVYSSIAAVPWAERAAVPWRHVAPAAEDPTIRTVRIVR